MARVKTIMCNDEIELSLFFDDARIARKYNMDIPRRVTFAHDENEDADGIIVVGVKANHHPMNREDRRRYARTEKKHLEKLSKYAMSGVRSTRNGAYVRDRSNDGMKEYFKGDKLWSRKIRHARVELNENDLTDEELGYDPDFDLWDDDYCDDYCNEYHMIFRDGSYRYNDELAYARLKSNPEAKMYIVVYSYDSWDDYYERRNYLLTVDAVIDEIKTHHIQQHENDMVIYGLYPSDTNRCEETLLYHDHVVL